MRFEKRVCTEEEDEEEDEEKKEKWPQVESGAYRASNLVASCCLCLFKALGARTTWQRLVLRADVRSSSEEASVWLREHECG